MKLPWIVLVRLVDFADGVIADRPPDQVIGGDTDYLRRWYVTPWSNYDRAHPPGGLRALARWLLPNLYVHHILRSDDDRALHDHPWWNLSIICRGFYFEHTIAAGGVHRRALRGAGSIKLRPPQAAHRLEIAVPCVTLFLTGPKWREWGFHCPNGWRHWREFTAPGQPGRIGRGCE